MSLQTKVLISAPIPASVGEITNSSLAADNIYHEGARTNLDAEPAPLSGNWYTGLTEDVKVTVTADVNGKDKTFDVEVPLALEAGETLTGTALNEAKTSSKYMEPLNSADTAVLALGFQLALPEKIYSGTIDYSKTTLVNGSNSNRDTHIFYGINDANRYEAAHMNDLASNTAKTLIMYTNAITFTPDATKGNAGTNFKAITATDLSGKMSYQLTINGTEYATWSNIIYMNPKHELDSGADSTVPGFGFNVAGNGTITGSATAAKMDERAEGVNAGFSQYVKVTGAKLSTDFDSVKFYRDDVVTDTLTSSSTNAIKVDGGDTYMRAGSYFAKKTGDIWAFTKQSFVQKVELLQGSTVVGTITKTVDF